MANLSALQILQLHRRRYILGYIIDIGLGIILALAIIKLANWAGKDLQKLAYLLPIIAIWWLKDKYLDPFLGKFWWRSPAYPEGMRAIKILEYDTDNEPRVPFHEFLVESNGKVTRIPDNLKKQAFRDLTLVPGENLKLRSDEDKIWEIYSLYYNIDSHLDLGPWTLWYYCHRRLNLQDDDSIIKFLTKYGSPIKHVHVNIADRIRETVGEKISSLTVINPDQVVPHLALLATGEFDDKIAQTGYFLTGVSIAGPFFDRCIHQSLVEQINAN